MNKIGRLPFLHLQAENVKKGTYASLHAAGCCAYILCAILVFRMVVNTVSFSHLIFRLAKNVKMAILYDIPTKTRRSKMVKVVWKWPKNYQRKILGRKWTEWGVFGAKMGCLFLRQPRGKLTAGQNKTLFFGIFFLYSLFSYIYIIIYIYLFCICI